MSEIVAQSPDQKGGKQPSRLSTAQLSVIKIAKREAAEKWQSDYTEVIDGYTIRPAIGRTGGVDNVGWELIPPKGSGPDWYLATRELCVAAIPRHRLKYA